MSFYQQISKYYDDIFPISPATLEFYLKLLDKMDANSVLDIACGSGNYVKAFLGKGYQAFGIDLDGAMVEKARIKTSPSHIFQGDMVRASNVFDRSFDCLLCIGNSIVHLKDEKMILSALTSFHKLLSPGGIVSLQTINYDRILDQHLERLPTIERPEIGLTFERRYRCDLQSGLIHFNTTLQVPEGTFENSIPLYPLRTAALSSLLNKAGYTDISLYGDFKGSPWQQDSYASIATAVRI